MNLRGLFSPLFSSFLLLSLFTVSCDPDDPQPASVATYSAEASLKWNELFLKVERYAAGYRPGPAPRALGLLGLAAYESCVTGMPDYNSLESRYASSGLSIPDAESGKEYHWPTVVHAVYTNMMPKFFPETGSFPPASVKDEWTTLVSDLNNKYLAEAGQEVFDRSKAYGESVGEAVWAWAITDSYGHDAYKNPFGNFSTNEEYIWQDHYVAPPDWEATLPGPGKGMGPYFGKARTFAITEAEKLSLPPTPEWSEDPNSEFYSQMLEVYTKNTPTYPDEYRWIGEFWSDDLVNLTFSPGPRWIAIANQCIEKENSNLETALEAYAKTGMALNDAAVACWHSKYYYNIERPVTYIRRLVDPNWEPNLDNPLTGEQGMTPSFPAYPSGHSTMGGAGAEALSSVFGYSYALTDNCHANRTEFYGDSRSFESLSDMAYENALSRVPLGVHVEQDCTEGVRLGTSIGRKVNKLPWKK